MKNNLWSLREELRCVEIYEKRKTDLQFELEKKFIQSKEENDNLRREIQFVLNSKNDIERAYKALLEDRKLADWELGTLWA